ncbi:MAG: hypothetical protein JO266_03970 [Acidobacteria bacterium]|nr:hypothetical protein [Acidobacteriota bacterium]
MCRTPSETNTCGCCTNKLHGNSGNGALIADFERRAAKLEQLAGLTAAARPENDAV